MTSYTFTIPGDPVAQARARATVSGGRAKVYKSRKDGQAEGLTRSAVVRQLEQHSLARGLPVFRSDTPVKLTVEGYWAAPKGAMKKTMDVHGVWRTKKPDLDNLLKHIMDALNGILWQDDVQVVQICAMKQTREVWKGRPPEPGYLTITVEDLSE